MHNIESSQHSRRRYGPKSLRLHLVKSQETGPKTIRGPPQYTGENTHPLAYRPFHLSNVALPTPGSLQSNFQSPSNQWLCFNHEMQSDLGSAAISFSFRCVPGMPGDLRVIV